MSDKILPFGFRQDAEPVAEPDEELPQAARQEISVTSASTERRWSPSFSAPAQAGDRGRFW